MAVSALGGGEAGGTDAGADEGGDVTDLDAGDVGDVHHGLVHADEADNGGIVFAEADHAFVAEMAGIAVAVANAEGGDADVASGGVGGVVADGVSGGNVADGGDAGEPGECGAGFSAEGVVGVYAVGEESGADEVLVGLVVEEAAEGVCAVDESGEEVVAAEGVEGDLEPGELGLAAFGVGGVDEVLN